MGKGRNDKGRSQSPALHPLVVLDDVKPGIPDLADVGIILQHYQHIIIGCVSRAIAMIDHYVINTGVIG